MDYLETTVQKHPASAIKFPGGLNRKVEVEPSNSINEEIPESS